MICSGSLRSRWTQARCRTKKKMIKQINEFIDWPALVEKLSPPDREVYEAMKSECKELMSSESPNHEKIQRLIREGIEFLITNPSLDPVSARELWREFVCSPTSSSLPSQPTVVFPSLPSQSADGRNDASVAESREEAETRLSMMYENRRETSCRKSVI